MSRAVAINVGANTNLPGFRGPIYPDGRFEYVPIPEREPTAEPVPTYADLPLSIDLPPDVRDTPVHLDPAFAGYGPCERHTYGDDSGVKAGPLAALEPGDWLYFYATLSRHGDPADPVDWIPPEWGTFLIGSFRVERAVTGEEYAALDLSEQSLFAGNAHLQRASPDPKVLVAGDPADSGLLDRAVPLSTPEAGADAGRLVTDLSEDSGKGPWWRRPLRFDADATTDLQRVVADHQP